MSWKSYQKENEYTDEEMREEFHNEVEDYFDECIRMGHYDMERNAREFTKNNKHMGVSYHAVLAILQKLESQS